MESQNDRILYITASMLYDFLKCEHRVWRDIYGPQDERIQEINPFVQLLWDKGIQHEKEIVAKLGDFVDLSQGTLQSRFKETMAAMKKGTPLIYFNIKKIANIYRLILNRAWAMKERMMIRMRWESQKRPTQYNWHYMLSFSNSWDLPIKKEA